MIMNVMTLQKGNLYLGFRVSLLRQMATNAIVKVPVKQGVVVGNEGVLHSGLQYNSFLGVPYAVPPLGKLRFKSPVPLQHFEQAELDCRKERDISHQRDPFTTSIVGSENCLFLNVYVPKTKQQNPLPVMVWIHGGGFLFGNGNSDFHFPEKLIDEEVIVVTLNYRLGALGFLYLPEEGIHGNAGLKDQRLALQWVQENIQSFNGDPNNVTLFGESAGAASVHLHAYAKHSNKLFHKAICQSGSANMEWVLQLEPEHKTRRLAEVLGYEQSTENTRQILEFLQSEKVTPNHILASNLPVLTQDEKRRGLPLAFKPVVEHSSSPDSFVDTPILESLQQPNRLGSLPMIMGYNSAEGLAMLVNAIRKLEQYDEDLERLVPRNLSLNPHNEVVTKIAQEMRNFYFQGKNISDKNLDALSELFTDYHFLVDLQIAAEIHTRTQSNAPLYVYRFDYVGDRNMYKRLFQLEQLRGACHADELSYLFQMSDDTSYSPKDEKLATRLCKLWANFARTNNPSDHDCIWKSVEKNPEDKSTFELDYLIIDKHCRMDRNPDNERIKFWRSIYHNNPVRVQKIQNKL